MLAQDCNTPVSALSFFPRTVRVPVRVLVYSRLCIECSPYRGRRPADATPVPARRPSGRAPGGMRTCWFLGGGTRVARARGRPTKTGRGALLYLSLGSFPAQAKTAHPYRRPNGSTDRWPSSTGRSILTIRYYCYRPRPPTATVTQGGLVGLAPARYSCASSEAPRARGTPRALIL